MTRHADLHVAGAGRWYSLVAADRARAASGVQRLLGNLPVAVRTTRQHSGAAFVLDGHDAAVVACLHRQPRLLQDHTVLENWALCLHGPGRSQDDLARELQEPEALYAPHQAVPRDAYPPALSELALVAAQLVQAHLLQPHALVLDALFSGWHEGQRAVVGQLVRSFAQRFPFRPIVHVDVEAAHPSTFPSEILELT